MPSPDDLTAAAGYQGAISGASGYLTPSQLLGTSQGQNWLQQLYNTYYGRMQSNTPNYGMPWNKYVGADGQETPYADDNLRSIMTMVLQNPSYNPKLYDWMMEQGGMPQVPTLARGALDSQNAQNAASNALANRSLDAQVGQWGAQNKLSADQLASNTAQWQASDATNRYGIDKTYSATMAGHASQERIAQAANQTAITLEQMRGSNQMAIQQADATLQRELQAGRISHEQYMQERDHLHQNAMQKEELAYKYSELAWTKEYGNANLGILRDRLKLDYDRLGMDREVAQWQKDHDARRVAVEEGRLGLEREKFGLDKNIQEAMLRANPYNAVANALYTRGAQVPGGQTQYGQSTATLDNSGVLPFLQQLGQGNTLQPMSGGGGMYVNQGGIGGNFAPRPNQISQQSAGNMNEAEKGITTSLAQYGGWNPNDYWKTAQNSWNTAGQKQMNFGGTRLG